MRQLCDCSIVAVAAAAKAPYKLASAMLEHIGKKKDQGVTFPYVEEALYKLGFDIEEVTDPVDINLNVLKETGETYLVVSWHDVKEGKGACHVTAVRDGKVFDNKSNNESRELIEKVYHVNNTKGYYERKRLRRPRPDEVGVLQRPDVTWTFQRRCQI